MGDDSDLNLNVSANTAGAVSTMDGLTSSVSEFDARVEALGNTFSRPLQSVGVHMFGRELLTTMGLGMEARPIIMLLNVAVTELGTAFGFAAGPMGLLVMGLVAVAAVGYKVIESHNKHKESLVQLLDTQVKSFESSKKTVEVFDELHKNLTTKLSPAMQAYEKDIRAKNAAESSSAIGTLLTQIKEEKESIDKLSTANTFYTKTLHDNKDAIDNATKSIGYGMSPATAIFLDQMGRFSFSLGENKKKLKELTSEMTANQAQAEALAHGFATAALYAESLSKNTKDASKAEEGLTRQIDALNSMQKQYAAEGLALTGTVWQTRTAKIQAELEKETRAIMDHYHKGVEAAKKDGTDTLALKVAALNAIAAAQGKAAEQGEAKEAEWFGISSGFMTGLSDIRSNTFKSMADGVGNAFGKMVVEGANWNKSMTALFKDLKEQFISAVVSMMVKWAAFSALKGMGLIATGGAAGAVFAAQGFVGTVSKPTTFVAGEAGEEFVSIIPKSQMGFGMQPLSSGMSLASGAAGAGAGGGNTTVNNYFTIPGADNPQAVADAVMQKIIYAVRGRGQIPFVRET